MTAFLQGASRREGVRVFSDFASAAKTPCKLLERQTILWQSRCVVCRLMIGFGFQPNLNL